MKQVGALFRLFTLFFLVFFVLAFVFVKSFFDLIRPASADSPHTVGGDGDGADGGGGDGGDS